MTNENDDDLDRLLNSYRVAPSSFKLKQSILASVDRGDPWRDLLALFGGWRFAGPVLAFSLICGVCAPLLLLQPLTASPTQDTLWAMAGLDSSEDWSYE